MILSHISGYLCIINLWSQLIYQLKRSVAKACVHVCRVLKLVFHFFEARFACLRNDRRNPMRVIAIIAP
jgi:hypothetical protein